MWAELVSRWLLVLIATLLGGTMCICFLNVYCSQCSQTYTQQASGRRIRALRTLDAVEGQKIGGGDYHCGVVLNAASEAKYFWEAVHIAWRVLWLFNNRRSSKLCATLNVTLFTDDHILQQLVVQVQSLSEVGIHSVAYKNEVMPRLKQTASRERWFDRMDVWFKRIWALEQSRSDLTLMMDLDALPCQGFDSLFDELGSHDVAATLAEKPYGGSFLNSSFPHPLGLSVEELNHWKVFPERNCGWLLFATGKPAVVSLIKAFKEAFIRELQHSDLYPIHGDQTAFREALFIQLGTYTEHIISSETVCRWRSSSNCLVYHPPDGDLPSTCDVPPVPSSFPTDPELPSVIFVKAYKVGSTTVAHMLLRACRTYNIKSCWAKQMHGTCDSYRSSKFDMLVGHNYCKGQGHPGYAPWLRNAARSRIVSLIVVSEPITRLVSSFFYRAGYTKIPTQKSMVSIEKLSRHMLKYLKTASSDIDIRQWKWLSKTWSGARTLLRSGQFVVGLTSQMDESILMFRKAIGLKLRDIIHINLKNSIKHPGLENFPQAVRQALLDLATKLGDLPYYREATLLFASQQAAYGNKTLQDDLHGYQALQSILLQKCESIKVGGEAIDDHYRSEDCVLDQFDELQKQSLLPPLSFA